MCVYMYGRYYRVRDGIGTEEGEVIGNYMCVEGLIACELLVFTDDVKEARYGSRGWDCRSFVRVCVAIFAGGGGLWRVGWGVR